MSEERTFEKRKVKNEKRDQKDASRFSGLVSRLSFLTFNARAWLSWHCVSRYKPTQRPQNKSQETKPAFQSSSSISSGWIQSAMETPATSVIPTNTLTVKPNSLKNWLAIPAAKTTLVKSAIVRASNSLRFAPKAAFSIFSITSPRRTVKTGDNSNTPALLERKAANLFARRSIYHLPFTIYHALLPRRSSLAESLNRLIAVVVIAAMILTMPGMTGWATTTNNTNSTPALPQGATTGPQPNQYAPITSAAKTNGLTPAESEAQVLMSLASQIGNMMMPQSGMMGNAGSAAQTFVAFNAASARLDHNDGAVISDVPMSGSAMMVQVKNPDTGEVQTMTQADYDNLVAATEQQQLAEETADFLQGSQAQSNAALSAMLFQLNQNQNLTSLANSLAGIAPDSVNSMELQDAELNKMLAEQVYLANQSYANFGAEKQVWTDQLNKTILPEINELVTGNLPNGTYSTAPNWTQVTQSLTATIKAIPPLQKQLAAAKAAATRGGSLGGSKSSVAEIQKQLNQQEVNKANYTNELTSLNSQLCGSGNTFQKDQIGNAGVCNVNSPGGIIGGIIGEQKSVQARISMYGNDLAVMNKMYQPTSWATSQQQTLAPYLGYTWNPLDPKAQSNNDLITTAQAQQKLVTSMESKTKNSNVALPDAAPALKAAPGTALTALPNLSGQIAGRTTAFNSLANMTKLSLQAQPPALNVIDVQKDAANYAGVLNGSIKVPVPVLGADWAKQQNLVNNDLKNLNATQMASYASIGSGSAYKFTQDIFAAKTVLANQIDIQKMRLAGTNGIIDELSHMGPNGQPLTADQESRLETSINQWLCGQGICGGDYPPTLETVQAVLQCGGRPTCNIDTQLALVTNPDDPYSPQSPSFYSTWIICSGLGTCPDAETSATLSSQGNIYYTPSQNLAIRDLADLEISQFNSGDVYDPNSGFNQSEQFFENYGLNKNGTAFIPKAVELYPGQDDSFGYAPPLNPDGSGAAAWSQETGSFVPLSGYQADLRYQQAASMFPYYATLATDGQIMQSQMQATNQALQTFNTASTALSLMIPQWPADPVAVPQLVGGTPITANTTLDDLFPQPSLTTALQQGGLTGAFGYVVDKIENLPVWPSFQNLASWYETPVGSPLPYETVKEAISYPFQDTAAILHYGEYLLPMMTLGATGDDSNAAKADIALRIDEAMNTASGGVWDLLNGGNSNNSPPPGAFKLNGTWVDQYGNPLSPEDQLRLSPLSLVATNVNGVDVSGAQFVDGTWVDKFGMPLPQYLQDLFTKQQAIIDSQNNQILGLDGKTLITVNPNDINAVLLSMSQPNIFSHVFNTSTNGGLVVAAVVLPALQSAVDTGAGMYVFGTALNTVKAFGQGLSMVEAGEAEAATAGGFADAVASGNYAKAAWIAGEGSLNLATQAVISFNDYVVAPAIQYKFFSQVAGDIGTIFNPNSTSYTVWTAAGDIVGTALGMGGAAEGARAYGFQPAIENADGTWTPAPTPEPSTLSTMTSTMVKESVSLAVGGGLVFVGGAPGFVGDMAATHLVPTTYMQQAGNEVILQAKAMQLEEGKEVSNIAPPQGPSAVEWLFGARALNTEQIQNFVNQANNPQAVAAALNQLAQSDSPSDEKLIGQMTSGGPIDFGNGAEALAPPPSIRQAANVAILNANAAELSPTDLATLSEGKAVKLDNGITLYGDQLPGTLADDTLASRIRQANGPDAVRQLVETSQSEVSINGTTIVIDSGLKDALARNAVAENISNPVELGKMLANENPEVQLTVAEAILGSRAPIADTVVEEARNVVNQSLSLDDALNRVNENGTAAPRFTLDGVTYRVIGTAEDGYQVQSLLKPNADPAKDSSWAQPESMDAATVKAAYEKTELDSLAAEAQQTGQQRLADNFNYMATQKAQDIRAAQLDAAQQKAEAAGGENTAANIQVARAQLKVAQAELTGLLARVRVDPTVTQKMVDVALAKTAALKASVATQVLDLDTKFTVNTTVNGTTITVKLQTGGANPQSPNAQVEKISLTPRIPGETTVTRGAIGEGLETAMEMVGARPALVDSALRITSLTGELRQTEDSLQGGLPQSHQLSLANVVNQVLVEAGLRMAEPPSDEQPSETDGSGSGNRTGASRERADFAGPEEAVALPPMAVDLTQDRAALETALNGVLTDGIIDPAASPDVIRAQLEAFQAESDFYGARAADSDLNDVNDNLKKAQTNLALVEAIDQAQNVQDRIDRSIERLKQQGLDESDPQIQNLKEQGAFAERQLNLLKERQAALELTGDEQAQTMNRIKAATDELKKEMAVFQVDRIDKFANKMADARAKAEDPSLAPEQLTKAQQEVSRLQAQREVEILKALRTNTSSEEYVKAQREAIRQMILSQQKVDNTGTSKDSKFEDQVTTAFHFQRMMDSVSRGMFGNSRYTVMDAFRSFFRTTDAQGKPLVEAGYAPMDINMAMKSLGKLAKGADLKELSPDEILNLKMDPGMQKLLEPKNGDSTPTVNPDEMAAKLMEFAKADALKQGSDVLSRMLRGQSITDAERDALVEALRGDGFTDIQGARDLAAHLEGEDLSKGFPKSLVQSVNKAATIAFEDILQDYYENAKLVLRLTGAGQTADQIQNGRIQVLTDHFNTLIRQFEHTFGESIGKPDTTKLSSLQFEAILQQVAFGRTFIFAPTGNGKTKVLTPAGGYLLKGMYGDQIGRITVMTSAPDARSAAFEDAKPILQGLGLHPEELTKEDMEPGNMPATIKKVQEAVFVYVDRQTMQGLEMAVYAGGNRMGDAARLYDLLTENHGAIMPDEVHQLNETDLIEGGGSKPVALADAPLYKAYLRNDSVLEYMRENYDQMLSETPDLLKKVEGELGDNEMSYQMFYHEILSKQANGFMDKDGNFTQQFYEAYANAKVSMDLSSDFDATLKQLTSGQGGDEVAGLKDFAYAIRQGYTHSYGMNVDGSGELTGSVRPISLGNVAENMRFSQSAGAIQIVGERIIRETTMSDKDAYNAWKDSKDNSTPSMLSRSEMNPDSKRVRDADVLTHFDFILDFTGTPGAVAPREGVSNGMYVPNFILQIDPAGKYDPTGANRFKDGQYIRVQNVDEFVSNLAANSSVTSRNWVFVAPESTDIQGYDTQKIVDEFGKSRTLLVKSGQNVTVYINGAEIKTDANGELLSSRNLEKVYADKSVQNEYLGRIIAPDEKVMVILDAPATTGWDGKIPFMDVQTAVQTMRDVLSGKRSLDELTMPEVQNLTLDPETAALLDDGFDPTDEANVKRWTTRMQQLDATEALARITQGETVGETARMALVEYLNKSGIEGASKLATILEGMDFRNALQGMTRDARTDFFKQVSPLASNVFDSVFEAYNAKGPLWVSANGARTSDQTGPQAWGRDRGRGPLARYGYHDKLVYNINDAAPTTMQTPADYLAHIREVGVEHNNDVNYRGVLGDLTTLVFQPYNYIAENAANRVDLAVRKAADAGLLTLNEFGPNDTIQAARDFLAREGASSTDPITQEMRSAIGEVDAIGQMRMEFESRTRAAEAQIGQQDNVNALDALPADVERLQADFKRTVEAHIDELSDVNRQIVEAFIKNHVTLAFTGVEDGSTPFFSKDNSVEARLMILTGDASGNTGVYRISFADAVANLGKLRKSDVDFKITSKQSSPVTIAETKISDLQRQMASDSPPSDEDLLNARAAAESAARSVRSVQNLSPIVALVSALKSPADILQALARDAAMKALSSPSLSVDVTSLPSDFAYRAGIPVTHPNYPGLAAFISGANPGIPPPSLNQIRSQVSALQSPETALPAFNPTFDSAPMKARVTSFLHMFGENYSQGRKSGKSDFSKPFVGLGWAVKQSIHSGLSNSQRAALILRAYEGSPNLVTGAVLNRVATQNPAGFALAQPSEEKIHEVASAAAKKIKSPAAALALQKQVTQDLENARATALNMTSAEVESLDGIKVVTTKTPDGKVKIVAKVTDPTETAALKLIALNELSKNPNVEVHIDLTAVAGYPNWVSAIQTVAFDAYRQGGHNTVYTDASKPTPSLGFHPVASTKAVASRIFGGRKTHVFNPTSAIKASEKVRQLEEAGQKMSAKQADPQMKRMIEAQSKAAQAQLDREMARLFPVAGQVATAVNLGLLQAPGTFKTIVNEMARQADSAAAGKVLGVHHKAVTDQQLSRTTSVGIAANSRIVHLESLSPVSMAYQALKWVPGMSRFADALSPQAAQRVAQQTLIAKTPTYLTGKMTPQELRTVDTDLQSYQKFIQVTLQHRQASIQKMTSAGKADAQRRQNTAIAAVQNVFAALPNQISQQVQQQFTADAIQGDMSLVVAIPAYLDPATLAIIRSVVGTRALTLLTPDKLKQFNAEAAALRQHASNVIAGSVPQVLQPRQAFEEGSNAVGLIPQGLILISSIFAHMPYGSVIRTMLYMVPVIIQQVKGRANGHAPAAKDWKAGMKQAFGAMSGSKNGVPSWVSMTILFGSITVFLIVSAMTLAGVVMTSSILLPVVGFWAAAWAGLSAGFGVAIGIFMKANAAAAIIHFGVKAVQYLRHQEKPVAGFADIPGIVLLLSQVEPLRERAADIRDRLNKLPSRTAEEPMSEAEKTLQAGYKNVMGQLKPLEDKLAAQLAQARAAAPAIMDMLPSLNLGDYEADLRGLLADLHDAYDQQTMENAFRKALEPTARHRAKALEIELGRIDRHMGSKAAEYALKGAAFKALTLAQPIKGDGKQAIVMDNTAIAEFQADVEDALIKAGLKPFGGDPLKDKPDAIVLVLKGMSVDHFNRYAGSLRLKYPTIIFVTDEKGLSSFSEAYNRGLENAKMLAQTEFVDRYPAALRTKKGAASAATAAAKTQPIAEPVTPAAPQIAPMPAPAPEPVTVNPAAHQVAPMPEHPAIVAARAAQEWLHLNQANIQRAAEALTRLTRGSTRNPAVLKRVQAQWVKRIGAIVHHGGYDHALAVSLIGQLENRAVQATARRQSPAPILGLAQQLREFVEKTSDGQVFALDLLKKHTNGLAGVPLSILPGSPLSGVVEQVRSSGFKPAASSAYPEIKAEVRLASPASNNSASGTPTPVSGANPLDADFLIASIPRLPGHPADRNRVLAAAGLSATVDLLSAQLPRIVALSKSAYDMVASLWAAPAATGAGQFVESGMFSVTPETFMIGAVMGLVALWLWYGKPDSAATRKPVSLLGSQA